jgi:hypothetical protein
MQNWSNKEINLSEIFSRKYELKSKNNWCAQYQPTFKKLMGSAIPYFRMIKLFFWV